MSGLLSRNIGQVCNTADGMMMHNTRAKGVSCPSYSFLAFRGLHPL